MQWTMPHRVLQIVASLLALAAAASFVAGVVNAPQRGGRLPGEKVQEGGPATGAAIDAPDATPLSNERIEGPPPPANDEAADADNATEADAGNSDADQAAANTAAAAAANAPAPAPPRISLPPTGNAAPPQTLGGPPAPDEPPH